MARTPDGPPPAPAVQKLRLRYSKTGPMRFSSHRDFQRALERALRSARVPTAFSAGFNPRPKVSYANAAPTGAASLAEYVEISVIERCDPDLVQKALNEALPHGLKITEVVEAHTPSLVERLVASSWQIELPGLDVADVRDGVDAFLAEQTVTVERLMKAGIRSFDARGAVVRARVDDTPEVRQTAETGPCAMIHLVVRHGTPSVRPDDILTGIRQVSGLEPPAPPVVTRLAQGPLDEVTGTIGDPLVADRAEGAAAGTAQQG